MHVRPLGAADRPWLEELVPELWGAPIVVGRGRVHRVAELPGFVALEGDARVGLVTYLVEGEACELVTINSLREGAGIGTRLVEAVVDTAREAGCRRVWLITTNDNLRMLRFAQRRGFSLVAVYPNALEESRKLKPEIPSAGMHRIPLRDELELELRL